MTAPEYTASTLFDLNLQIGDSTAVLRGHWNYNRDLVGAAYLTNPDYPTVPSVRVQDAIYYAYTEVVMDEERDLVLGS